MSTISERDIMTFILLSWYSTDLQSALPTSNRVVGSGISFVAQQDIVVTAEETAQRQSFSPTAVGTRHPFR